VLLRRRRGSSAVDETVDETTPETLSGVVVPTSPRSSVDAAATAHSTVAGVVWVPVGHRTLQEVGTVHQKVQERTATRSENEPLPGALRGENKAQ